jgi:hypothetical protein
MLTYADAAPTSPMRSPLAEAAQLPNYDEEDEVRKAIAESMKSQLEDRASASKRADLAGRRMLTYADRC